jgi:hypothetical protein
MRILYRREGLALQNKVISKSDRMKQIVACVTVASLCFGAFWKLLDHRTLFEAWQLQLISIMLIVSGIATLTYGSIWPWIYKWAVGQIGRHREETAAKKLLPPLIKCVNSFADVSVTDRCLTLRHCLREVRNSNPDLLEVDHWFCNLWQAFEHSGWQNSRSKKELVVFALWFDSLVSVFNEQIVCEPVRRLTQNHQINFPHDWHNNYHNAKADYAAFIRDYKQFAKDANIVLQGIGLREYFDVPKIILFQESKK